MTEPEPYYKINPIRLNGSLLTPSVLDHLNSMSADRQANLYSIPAGCQRQYLARFVRSGRIRYSDNSPADIHVSAEALEAAAAAGMFENKAVFVDHAGFFEYPSLDNLVGVTLLTGYDPVDQAVIGTIRMYPTPEADAIATILDDMLANPDQSPDVGLSMVCYPEWKEENHLRVLQAIRHIESIDIVFQPAADGRILAALSTHFAVGVDLRVNPSTPQAARTPWTTQHDEHGIASQRTLATTVQIKKGEPPTMPPPILNPNPDPPVGTDGVRPQEQASAWTQALASSATQVILANSGLPQLSQDRLAAQAYADPQALQDAIEQERDYLAQLVENSVVHIGNRPPRSPQITGMTTSVERIALAFEALMSGTPPANGIRPLTGIRELYHTLSGDYEMTGMFQPDRVQLAAVTSSTMANLVANVLNKRIANEFQEYPQWWLPIVNIEDFMSLQQVKWITLGGIGELPTVAEGAAYTELTWDDAAETATFVKKGGYLGITMEAIDKDDTGRVRAAPRALAQAAWLTLSKAISDIFTSNSGVGPTMSDSVALFNAAHSNLGTTALSMSSWNAVKLAMRKQTELNSGERLGGLVVPRYLLVPPDLEATALQIMASELDYTYALSNAPAAPANVNTEGSTPSERMAYARSRVVVVDLWTDTNNWAASADPRFYPTIGLAFRYGRTPEIFSVASPTAGLMFTNDTMPVKVRFFYATAPIDYRGLYKQNVA